MPTLSEVRLRRDALSIWRTGLKAANPSDAVAAFLARRRDLLKYQRVFVVGAGKATGTMAHAVEKALGKRITAGSINVPDGDASKFRRIETQVCRHPRPDERGVAGAMRIADICTEANESDLVICLISGGASALLPYPADGITLADKQGTTDLLLASGASIQEFNIVRKHLSRIKGGQLARLAWPARVLCLILSDVVGDDVSAIGSGPMAPDPSTVADALAVLDRYDLRRRVPEPVRLRFEGSPDETPKPGDPIFSHVENVVVGTNQKSLEAAARKAKELGYRAVILSSTIQGETKDIARMHGAIAQQIRHAGQPVRPPACLISGGETTVTIPEGCGGKGGRNQEFALAAALEIAGLNAVVVLSAGTDGIDGPTDAAGAIADGRTVSRANNAPSALTGHNAYPLFDALGDLLRTGPTGTNVMDLRVVLVG